MSKCDISISFDREDRTYSGGESVTGRVKIQLHQDVSSSGIKLTHQWRTHGRGNVGVGPKQAIELAPAGPLVAGETLDLPFSLLAPKHPVTYHGYLINIDHYVGVEIIVPWSFNPKAEEEYILKGGTPPDQFVGSRSEVISLATKPAKMGLVLSLIVWPLAIVFLVMFSAVAIFLLPIILIVAIFFWLRRRAIAARLGEVTLSMPHVIVAPGTDWTFRLQFQPRKQFAINGIFLTLLGKETATSGSGTQATTSVHNVLEKKITVRAPEILDAGVPVDQNFALAFPDTTAYSFEESDNKIEWTAQIRIDIPYFPDWTKTQKLQVVPAEFLKNLAHAPTTTADSAQRIDLDSPQATPVRSTQPVVPQSNDFLEEQLEFVGEPSDLPPATLDELVARIASVPRHGTARATVVESVIDEIFDATLTVDRVNSTIAVVSSMSGYEDGKTIIGIIQGTQQSVEVITPRAFNDQIDDLRRGDTWQPQICIVGWDNLYNRIKARQIDERG